MSASDNLFGKAVHDALHDDRELRPSPDLFSRVVDSIDADRLRRRRQRTVVALWAAAVALVTTLIVTLTPRNLRGELAMPWWVLELATTAVLIAIALWLGPFIKRFGRAYAADVFHDNPLTGKSYILLTDVVYYLIFTAYILFTVQFAPPDHWSAYAGTAGGTGAVRGRARGWDPAHHRRPARTQHRAHAGGRAAVLPEPPAASRIGPPSAAVGV